MSTFFRTIVICVSLQTTVLAHRSHTSVAEVEWNSDSNAFEVAMRLHIADLEDAISVQQNSKFRIEGSDNAEASVRDYLRNRFRIKKGRVAFETIKWVGMELELHDAWVYFEVSANDDSLSKRAPGSTSSGRVEKWEDLFSKTPASTTAGQTLPSNRAQGVPDDLEFSNLALFEVQPEQKNVVTFTENRRTRSVVLLPQRPTKSLPSASETKMTGWQRRR